MVDAVARKARPMNRVKSRSLVASAGTFKLLLYLGAIPLCAYILSAQTAPAPEPTGKLVDLGTHKLHVNCTGNGSPTVVVENGLGDFSFDWILVQTRVAGFTRVCTYDRAGYAWSDPGPKPRTFAQINLELHDALEKLGERGPFVLIGHAIGGPIVRNYATTYSNQVVGVIFVDGVSEDDRFEMWKRAVLMRDGAKGRTVPSPREN